jgi:hypothetical protein
MDAIAVILIIVGVLMALIGMLPCIGSAQITKELKEGEYETADSVPGPEQGKP